MKEIAFIFDLDGVICDTAKYHYVAWKALADSLGIDFTIQDNERLKGVSRMESLEILLSLGQGEYSKTQKENFAYIKNELYKNYISNMKEDEILEGVLEFLTIAKQKGIKMAIGSASKNASTILDNLNIKYFFDCIVDGNNIEKAKPDPEVFVSAAQQLGVDPHRCIVFEDSQAGIMAAKNGRMKIVGIGNEEQLGEADVVINGFKDNNLDELLEYYIKTSQNV